MACSNKALGPLGSSALSVRVTDKMQFATLLRTRFRVTGSAIPPFVHAEQGRLQQLVVPSLLRQSGAYTTLVIVRSTSGHTFAATAFAALHCGGLRGAGSPVTAAAAGRTSIVFHAPSVSHSLLFKVQAKTFNKITCVGSDVLTLAAPLPSSLEDTETWAFYERIHEK